MQRTERRKLCSRTLMAVKGGKFFLVQGPESMPLAAVLLEALKQNLGKIFRQGKRGATANSIFGVVGVLLWAHRVGLVRECPVYLAGQNLFFGKLRLDENAARIPA